MWVYWNLRFICWVFLYVQHGIKMSGKQFEKCLLFYFTSSSCFFFHCDDMRTIYLYAEYLQSFLVWSSSVQSFRIKYLFHSCQFSCSLFFIWPFCCCCFVFRKWFFSSRSLPTATAAIICLQYTQSFDFIPISLCRYE